MKIKGKYILRHADFYVEPISFHIYFYSLDSTAATHTAVITDHTGVAMDTHTGEAMEVIQTV